MVKILPMCKKIILALNFGHHTHLVLNTSSFWGAHGQVNIYIVKDAVIRNGVKINKELFASSSVIHILYYLTDLLYFMDNLSIPPKDESRVESYYAICERKKVNESFYYMEDTYCGVEGESDD